MTNYINIKQKFKSYSLNQDINFYRYYVYRKGRNAIIPQGPRAATEL